MIRGPYEVDATGTKLMAAEIEASDETAFRPRRELAKMTFDDHQTLRFFVRAANCFDPLLTALQAASNDVILAAETARAKGLLDLAEELRSHHAIYCAAIAKAQGKI